MESEELGEFMQAPSNRKAAPGDMPSTAFHSSLGCNHYRLLAGQALFVIDPFRLIVLINHPKMRDRP